MKKKPIQFMLIACTIVIWGVIIFQVYLALKKSGDDPIKSDDLQSDVVTPVKLPSLGDSSETAFIQLARDPFSFPSVHHEAALVKSTAADPDYQPAGIIYRIAGIIINSGSKVIMLEDLSYKKTLYLHENEKYENLQILKINDKTVLLRESGIPKTFEITK